MCRIYYKYAVCSVPWSVCSMMCTVVGSGAGADSGVRAGAMCSVQRAVCYLSQVKHYSPFQLDKEKYVKKKIISIHQKNI